MNPQKNIFFIIMALFILTLTGCAKDKKDNPNSTSATLQNNIIQESTIIQKNNITSLNATISKLEGKRQEFLRKLDQIEKELDALPEKKDSDSGVTNAMKNYYGKSYDMYDQALNEIYNLLKKELSPEIMNDLKEKQLKWINQKEEVATKERQKYNGGTFENVAYTISLSDSTKKRCYELVNDYMTD